MKAVKATYHVNNTDARIIACEFIHNIKQAA